VTVNRKLRCQNEQELIETIFDWCVSGPYYSHKAIKSQATLYTTNSDNLNSILQSFWEIESILSPSQFPPEEMTVVEHFNSTHKYVGQ